MSTFDRAGASPLAAWPVVAAVLAGLLLALLVSSAPMLLVVGGVVALLFMVLFLGRPDLGILALLVARASTDLALVLGAGGVARGTLSVFLDPSADLILMVFFGGVLFVLLRRVPLLDLPGGRLFALLLLLGLAGMVRSPHVLLNLNEWLPVASVFVVYGLVAYLFRTPAAIQRVVDAFAVSFVLPALVGFYQLATHRNLVYLVQLPGEPPFRVSSTFVHPSAFGFYLVFMLSVFICQALAHTGARRRVALLIVVASGILLVGTFARASWVGAIMVLLVVGALRSPRLLLAAPLVAALALAIPSVSTRLQDPFGGSFASRVQTWQTVWQQWNDATSVEESAVTAVNRLSGLGPAETPPGLAHDDYLQVLADYGALGLASYVALAIVLVVFAYRTWRSSIGDVLSAVPLSLLVLALAYAVMSSTENIFAHTENQIYFWALAGLSVAVGRIMRPPREEGRPGRLQRDVGRG